MPGAVRLTPIFSRVRAAGADVSTTVGKLVVYGEVAAQFVSRNAPYDRLHSIVGGNYSWDSLGLRWLDQVTLIAEYARETVLGSDSTSDVVDPASLNPFRDAFVSRLQFKFTEDTQLKFTAVLNLVRQPSHLLQVKASHKVTDTIHLEAGLDFFAGSRDTFYGRWKDNDRFFFSAKYYF